MTMSLDESGRAARTARVVAAARAVAAGYLPYSSTRSLFFELWFELGIVGVCAAAFVTRRVFLVAGAVYVKHKNLKEWAQRSGSEWCTFSGVG